MFITFCIMQKRIFMHMDGAIQFNYQFGLCTIKIYDIGFNDALLINLDRIIF